MLVLRNDSDEPIPESWLHHALEWILGREEAEPDSEVSLLFTNDRETRDCNRRYRAVDETTDVLSFPADIPGAPVLGDILINLDHVRRCGRPRDAEIRILFIHGLLHLLGYDHLSAEGERIMYSRQNEYAEALKPRE